MAPADERRIIAPNRRHRRLFVFVCGILTWPGASRNWTGRAVTWIHTNSSFKAEKVEYLVGPLTRPFGQTYRARKLARMLSFYEGWNITLVGHSNGCDVIRDALAISALPMARLTAHFLSPACFAPSLPVRSLTVWQGGRDWQLRLASSWLGRALGYGTMGTKADIFIPHFGHSDWFTPPVNFNTTLSHLLLLC